MNAAEPQFVFGYGSLVGEHARGHVTRLRGWRRCWGVAMDNGRDLAGYKSYRLRAGGARPQVLVAFLDIEPRAGCALTGVCLPVDEPALRLLDGRERNYARVDVSDSIDGVRGRVWTYVGSEAGRARLRDGLARGRAVVSAEYLAAVLAGVAAIAPGEVEEVERSPADAGLAVLDLVRVEIGDAVPETRERPARPAQRMPQERAAQPGAGPRASQDS